jgi:signal transduction histidine kinase
MASSLKPQDLIETDVIAIIKEAWEHVIEPEDVVSQIEINQEPGHCFVLANDLLLEVFINLLRNALQYSEEVKRIKVEIQPEEQNNVNFWKICLIDWGKGISPEQKEKLFTRYTEGAKGLGLGLSVVKSLTEAFGGSVTVENRVLDDYTKGSVFILRLVRSN